MEFSKLGIAFVDENIKNHKKIESEISEKEDDLIEEAKEKLMAWLSEKGLKVEMGIVILKQMDQKVDGIVDDLFAGKNKTATKDPESYSQDHTAENLPGGDKSWKIKHF